MNPAVTGAAEQRTHSTTKPVPLAAIAQYNFRNARAADALLEYIVDLSSEETLRPRMVGRARQNDFWASYRRLMITSAQVMRILEVVQEFVGSNPNEVTTLADNPRLIELIHSLVNQPDAARVN